MHMPIKRRKLILCIVVLDLIALAVLAYIFRYTFLPKRFAEVEPGLYRAGYCQPGPLSRIIREKKLRTILVLLNDEPDTQEQKDEEAVARREGVKLIRIGMPGDGTADFVLLEQAAAVIADPANRPVLVHCAAGVNRTGAAGAVYRMKHLGWTFEQALAEMERYGYSQSETPQLREHLKRYYAERIAAGRPATAASE